LKIYIKIFIASLFGIFPFVSIAQTGIIKGTLKNKLTNESIINTEMIFILNDSIIKTVMSDSEGFFNINQINPSKYKVKVIVNNFKDVIKKKVFVEDVRTCYMFLELEPVKNKVFEKQN